MYRLKRPTNKQLSDFYDAYSPRIQELMTQLANGVLTIPLTLGRGTTAVHLMLKVQRNSATWQFLTKYAQEANLRKLLCGGWQEHIVIIREVERLLPGLAWQEGMTKGEYDAGHYAIYETDADGKEIVEDFNEILHWLFVDQLYDGDKNGVHLDKTAFVRERGLRVCPYCGRAYIDMAEVDGSVSKPNIDHFLPKSKYPFLAMSYMNLIPACNTCNEAANKGTLDPLTHPGHNMLLMNPHEFREDVVTFSYSYNHQGENNEDNFCVGSVAENDYFEQGYLKALKLREFYSHQLLEVKDMYRDFTKVTNSMKKFMIKLGVKKPFLDNIEHRTLGYSLNDEEAPKRLMYKFKKDIFGKLKEDYGI